MFARVCLTRTSFVHADGRPTGMALIFKFKFLLSYMHMCMSFLAAPSCTWMAGPLAWPSFLFQVLVVLHACVYVFSRSSIVHADGRPTGMALFEHKFLLSYMHVCTSFLAASSCTRMAGPPVWRSLSTSSHVLHARVHVFSRSSIVHADGRPTGMALVFNFEFLLSYMHVCTSFLAASSCTRMAGPLAWRS
jgi:Na+-transporting methylmalonyl-CoA/oxaloacetate decarboxylase gamma subunit